MHTRGSPAGVCRRGPHVVGTLSTLHSFASAASSCASTSITWTRPESRSASACSAGFYAALQVAVAVVGEEHDTRVRV